MTLCLIRWRDACAHTTRPEPPACEVCESVGWVQRHGEELHVLHGRYVEPCAEDGPVTVIPLGWQIEVYALATGGRIEPIDL